MFRGRGNLLAFGIVAVSGAGIGLYAVSEARSTIENYSSPTPSQETVVMQNQRGTPYPRRSFNLVDDSTLYRDFYEFREQLRQAIKQRNAKFVRLISVPNIRLTFGPPQTWDDLNIDDSKAPVWQEMERTFMLGCRSRNRGQFWDCPSISSTWNDELNPFDYLIILQKKVPVYAQASTHGKPIGFLSVEIVKLDREVQLTRPIDSGWVRIIQPNGQLGYVEEQFTYSPVGNRAAFQREGRSWKLLWFIGGD